jgi:CheY-like chemotaxis protein
MKQLEGVRVLVVEDDEDSREMYAHYLGHVGMQVATATNGVEALECVERFKPEIVVMDVSMPILSGDEVALVLKQDPATRRIPLVALTGYGHLGPTDRSRFDVFCRKPMLPDDLAAILVSTLAGAAKSSTT